MRYIFFLLLIPTLCFSQDKKDKKIIVTVSDTANLFSKVKLSLYEQGYTVEQSDEQLKFIATGEKSLGSRSIKLRTLIKEGKITFTGTFANDVTLSFGGAKAERTFMELYYGGMKGSDLRIAWNEMEKVAKSFGQITYSK